MARSTKMLGVADISRLAGAKRHPCGGQLYLEISPETGKRRWLARYSLNGMPTWQSLGPCDTGNLGTSLRDARDLVRLVLDAIEAGEDPRAVKLPDRRVAGGATRIVFADCLAAYLEAHEPRWANEALVLTKFKRWCAAILPKPVARVDASDVEGIFRPHWRRVAITSQRMRRRLERVLAYATRKGWRSGDNPATLETVRDLLGKEPEHVVKPHRALPWQDAPAIYWQASKLENIGARPLMLAILCAMRVQEARDLRWSEVDLHAKTITLPPIRGRMKQHQRQEALVIPLSGLALDLLGKTPRVDGQELVFGALGKDALRNVMERKLKLKGKATSHGYRSTWFDWCMDNRITDSAVANFQLGHKIKDKVLASYWRTKQLAERARALEAWADYLDNGFVVPGKGKQITRKVVRMGARKAA